MFFGLVPKGTKVSCVSEAVLRSRRYQRRNSQKILVRQCRSRPIVPYIDSNYASTEMQSIDIERQFLINFGLLQPNQLSSHVIELGRSFLAQHLGKFLTKRRCQLCKRPCGERNQCTTAPCAHKFHISCLLCHHENYDGICPLEHCRAEVAVIGDPIFGTWHYVNPMHLDARMLLCWAKNF